MESKKTIIIGLPDGPKTFKIDFAVWAQYRRVTDTQTGRRTDIFRRQGPRYAERREG